MDYNELRKDTEIGACIFELAKLYEDATQEDLSLPILKDGKQRGDLRFDVSYFPVLKPQVNESGVEELPESSEFGSSISPIFGNTHNRARRRGHRAIHCSPVQGP
jgi:Ca2+-dependent lipid-binding protein